MPLIYLPQWTLANVGIVVVQALSLGGFFGEIVGGNNAGYSKFANVEKPSVSSRTGMLIIYTPALLTSLTFLVRALQQDEGGNGRELLTAALLVVHFLKRDLEVLFVHSYSSTMEISATFICVVYALSAALICHQQAAVDHYDGGVLGDVCGGPVVTGCTLFLLGELGNLYHHCLLTELRKRGEKSYVIPTGAMFDLVTMPHYFCEIVAWFGIAVVTQQLNAFLVVCSSASYLMGRSYATTCWYQKKFPNYPPRKHMIPYMF
jgi:very-long-chain enoyl-CoA reductase